MQEPTPEELERAIANRKEMINLIVDMGVALSLAIPYVTPQASKNSAKGDQAMSVLSHMMNGIDRAKKVMLEIAPVTGKH